jgi:hypothetical protein
MTRAEDLHTLGLSSEDDEATDHQRRIRLAYLRLSRERHPDKGGTNEGFQKLSEAYYRLRDDTAQGRSEDQDRNASEHAEERSDEGPSWQDYDYENFWHDEFFRFFRQRFNHEYGYSDEEDDDFHTWEQDAYERKKEWSKIHKQQLKEGVDFRDVKAQKETDCCVFCGENKPIEKQKAENNGIEWEGYVESKKPRAGKGKFGYNTCWLCKTKHISVLTEALAKTKFAKKLKDSSIFQELKRAKYTFTAQPKTEFCPEPRISEYFWYPDLEAAALAAGWKPRGEQKESVPWQPKNRNKRKLPNTPTQAAVVTPNSSAKKSKRQHREDDDKKLSAKRGLKF